MREHWVLKGFWRGGWRSSALVSNEDLGMSQQSGKIHKLHPFFLLQEPEMHGDSQGQEDKCHFEPQQPSRNKRLKFPRPGGWASDQQISSTWERDRNEDAQTPVQISSSQTLWPGLPQEPQLSHAKVYEHCNRKTMMRIGQFFRRLKVTLYQKGFVITVFGQKVLLALTDQM